jgi:hypothetical protein
MPEPQSKAVPTKPDPKAPAEPEAPRSRLSWLVGWVLVPGVIIGVLFGGGVLVGAHFHDSWFVRAIVWVVELFV